MGFPKSAMKEAGNFKSDKTPQWHLPGIPNSSSTSGGREACNTSDQYSGGSKSRPARSVIMCAAEPSSSEAVRKAILLA